MANTPLLSAAQAAPCRNAAALSGADLVLTQTPSRLIVAAVAGNIKVDTLGGQSAVTIAIAAGVPLPLRVTKIYNSGTTATGVTALW